MQKIVPTLAALLLLLAAAPAPAPDIAHGRELATRLGCASCHAEGFTGHAMVDDPTIAILYSANLTRAVPGYSDAQLDRVIRTGVRPDGSRLWYMDAAPYAVIAKRDMADLIAFLRSLPAAGEARPRIATGPRFVKAVNAGRLYPESLTLDDDLAQPAIDLGTGHARGRYLARTLCGVCHKPDLSGYKEGGESPDLTAAAGYDRAQFRTLLRTGKAIGGREVGDMSVEARKRFGGLRDDEIDAIHAYLSARASH